MKNKLGVIGALILSLAIAGSAFAASPTPTVKNTKTAATTTKKVKKHRKHRKHRKHKAAKKTSSSADSTTMMKSPNTKKASPK